MFLKCFGFKKRPSRSSSARLGPVSKHGPRPKPLAVCPAKSNFDFQTFVSLANTEGDVYDGPRLVLALKCVASKKVSCSPANLTNFS